MTIKKMIYVVLGCISLMLGAAGAVLPLLPAFPFLMSAAFCFARSSDRLDRWFRSTKLYRSNLESYVNGEGMTIRVKIRIVCMVTALMAIGFAVMLTKQIFIGCMLLSAVWVFHLLYFAFGIRTKQESETA